MDVGEYVGFEALHKGCHLHYHADKIFHRSEFFHWGSSVCVDALKEATFESKVERRWFIGHVLFELLVDRILIRHQPSAGLHFYENLSRVEAGRVLAFIEKHEHREPERFLRFFTHFRNAAYIRNYPDNNLFAFSLSRIVQRAGLPPLTMADQMVLIEVVNQLENGAFRNAQEVLFQLKSVFR